MRRLSLLALVAGFVLVAAAPAAHAQGFSGPPWWQEGETWIVQHGGTCTDSLAVIGGQSGTTRRCDITDPVTPVATCQGTSTASTWVGSCSVYGPDFITCQRGMNLPGASDRSWTRAADRLELATLAECAAKPIPIVDLLVTDSSKLRVIKGVIGLPLRLYGTAGCSFSMNIRSQTPKGKKEVRRKRASATLKAGKRALPFKLSRADIASLSRAKGKIALETYGTCTLKPGPGQTFVNQTYPTLIRPPAPKR